MEIDRALDQISQIHEHMARSEVYRGYRAVPVAVSGGLAILAAYLQTWFVGAEPSKGFILYWVVVASVCGLTAGGGIIYNYAHEKSPLVRRKTRTVVGQYLPCIAAGLLVSGVFAQVGGQFISLLPGLWAVIFSLGIFASRPYLPRVIGFVALYHLIMGGLLLARAVQDGSVAPWEMGMTFGVGQIFAGAVLYRDLERNEIR